MGGLSHHCICSALRATWNSHLQNRYWYAESVRCHRARSSERWLLEQTQFPTLYSVSSFIQCIVFNEVFSFSVFCLQAYHRKCFQKYIVPLKRLEPNVIPMLLSWGCALWVSTCQSHSCGDLLSTEPLVPSVGWVPPWCLCNLSGHSWDMFLKSHKLFQLHNFWQEQATLRGSSW